MADRRSGHRVCAALDGDTSPGLIAVEPGEAHGYPNTGTGALRLTAIHGARRFNKEWLAGPDPVWSSKP